MTLAQILVFIAIALFYNALLAVKWRGWFLLAASILAIYWLQPALPIRQLDFILPTLALPIAVSCWFLIRQQERLSRDDYWTLAVVVGFIMLVASTRYLVPELRLTTRPPELLPVALVLLLALVFWRALPRSPILISLAIGFIILIFVILKYEPLSVWLSTLIRTSRGQETAPASVLDLGWLGFSYLAFRLIHSLRDAQTGQLPALSLREYLVYLIFFPAHTAGPIDRVERFTPDYRDLTQQNDLVSGGARIVIGLFKKFVVADSLAVIALNATSAAQATSSGGLWALLYAYSFRLLFDFSGYTDIAIGLGMLYGIRLPENFTRPYLQSNIAAFWQSWHITLSNWVRFYVFSPLSRWLLSRPARPPMIAILFVCHLTTMLIIGLWHGITLNFALWGLWHGLGLFIHKLWSDRTRRWYRNLKQKPRLHRVWTVCTVLLTFHFVVLGWVWFALPNSPLAVGVFRKLFGL